MTLPFATIVGSSKISSLLENHWELHVPPTAGCCFKSATVDKTKIGSGFYGSVFKAQCDDLICAAKCPHDDGLFLPTAMTFLDEIKLLASLRHPNIVQYLGVAADPESNLPILLMEKLDESLTQFLSRAQAPLSLPTELGICYDITLALSYLHSNGIVHRDLSSNNVLMLGARRAKVSDFGIAGRLYNKYSTYSQYPRTEVYMPLEAVQDKLAYTEKIDCFSFGVLAIQVVTRSLPMPGLSYLQVNTSHGICFTPQSEYYRRKNDIDKIPPGHVLQYVIHCCIKDAAHDRPSANILCSQLGTLQKEHGILVEQEYQKELADKTAKIEHLKAALMNRVQYH